MIQAKERPFPAATSLFYRETPTTDSTCKLVFNKYSEDRIFLSQIWRDGDGVELPKANREREAVTSKLLTGVRPTVITILARAR
jgi:hypothetical protein